MMRAMMPYDDDDGHDCKSDSAHPSAGAVIELIHSI